MSWTLLHWTQVFDIATKVLVILGGGFTAYQYHQSLVTARVERTFEYVEAVSRGKEAKARLAITAELLARQDQLRALREKKLSPKDARQVHAGLVRMLVQDSRGGRGLELELDSLVNLFQEVEICIDRSLCDAGVAQAFLGETGRSLWDNFEPYFIEQRTLIPNYAAGMEHFVKTLPKQ